MPRSCSSIPVWLLAILARWADGCMSACIAVKVVGFADKGQEGIGQRQRIDIAFFERNLVGVLKVAVHGLDRTKLHRGRLDGEQRKQRGVVARYEAQPLVVVHRRAAHPSRKDTARCGAVTAEQWD